MPEAADLAGNPGTGASPVLTGIADTVAPLFTLSYSGLSQIVNAVEAGTFTVTTTVTEAIAPLVPAVAWTDGNGGAENDHEPQAMSTVPTAVASAAGVPEQRSGKVPPVFHEWVDEGEGQVTIG